MPTTVRDWLDSSQEPGMPSMFPMWVVEKKHLAIICCLSGYMSVACWTGEEEPGYKQGTLLWDVSTQGVSQLLCQMPVLSYCVTCYILRLLFFQGDADETQNKCTDRRFKEGN